MTLEEAIHNAEKVINQATQAAWNAGAQAAYEIAAAKADAVAEAATTDGGKGAARYIAKEIRKIKDEVKG